MKGRHWLDADRRRDVLARLSERLAARTEVRFAFVHGSFNESGPVGDIDVAVSLEPDAPETADAAPHEITLEAALERGLGLAVDVRVLDEAPLSFQYAVTRGHLLFVRDAAALATFRERTWRAYLDFAPLREETLRDLATHLAGARR